MQYEYYRDKEGDYCVRPVGETDPCEAFMLVYENDAERLVELLNERCDDE